MTPAKFHVSDVISAITGRCYLLSGDEYAATLPDNRPLYRPGHTKSMDGMLEVVAHVTQDRSYVTEAFPDHGSGEYFDRIKLKDTEALVSRELRRAFPFLKHAEPEATTEAELKSWIQAQIDAGNIPSEWLDVYTLEEYREMVDPADPSTEIDASSTPALEKKGRTLH